jgi:hypothetical protein
MFSASLGTLRFSCSCTHNIIVPTEVLHCIHVRRFSFFRGTLPLSQGMPSVIVEQLKNPKGEKALKKHLQECKVSLKSNPMSWIEKFKELDGLDHLVAIQMLSSNHVGDDRKYVVLCA